MTFAAFSTFAAFLFFLQSSIGPDTAISGAGVSLVGYLIWQTAQDRKERAEERKLDRQLYEKLAERLGENTIALTRVAESMSKH